GRGGAARRRRHRRGRGDPRPGHPAQADRPSPRSRTFHRTAGDVSARRLMAADDIGGLAAARGVLGDRVLGPREVGSALGFEPLAVLTATERALVSRLPFTAADLERARADGEMLVLRIPRDPDGPLTMLRLARRLAGGDAPAARKGRGPLPRPGGRARAQ